jgi:hypothetical protein
MKRIAGSHPSLSASLTCSHPGSVRIPIGETARPAAVAAWPCFGQNVFSHLRQPENIVEFPKGQQPGVRRDSRSMKFQLEPPVEIEPQNSPIRFTRLGAPLLSPRCRGVFVQPHSLLCRSPYLCKAPGGDAAPSGSRLPSIRISRAQDRVR